MDRLTRRFDLCHPNRFGFGIHLPSHLNLLARKFARLTAPRAAAITASVIGCPVASAFAALRVARTPVPIPGMNGAAIAADWLDWAEIGNSGLCGLQNVPSADRREAEAHRGVSSKRSDCALEDISPFPTACPHPVLLSKPYAPESNKECWSRPT
jgi:hypothetical protein